MSQQQRIDLASPAEFMLEEMEARGWTGEDVVARSGAGGTHKLAMRILVACAHEDPRQHVVITTRIAGFLATAFGTSPELWLSLYRRYHDVIDGDHL